MKQTHHVAARQTRSRPFIFNLAKKKGLRRVKSPKIIVILKTKTRIKAQQLLKLSLNEKSQIIVISIEITDFKPKLKDLDAVNTKSIIVTIETNPRHLERK